MSEDPDEYSFSSAEIMHSLSEREINRFDGFKTPLEESVNEDNRLAIEINSPLTFRVGSRVYLIKHDEHGNFYACRPGEPPHSLGTHLYEVEEAIKEADEKWPE